jgi:hypothetical protein
MKKAYIVFLLSLFAIVNLYSQQIVSITDFGYIPGSKDNVIPALNEAIEKCKMYDSAILFFPNGRYDFWPAGNDPAKITIGIDLQKMKNIVVEGSGSEFIFHGRRMQIAYLDSCTNFILRNFSVDWDRPYISQAKIINASGSFLDVEIDREKYPYVIENGKILFIGEDWKMPVMDTYNNLYDKISKEIVYNTWDSPLRNIFSREAEELPNGHIRFHGETPYKPEPGTYVSLFHQRYAVNGLHIKNSKDIILRNLKIYHALSHGVLGERTENITMDNASMTANAAKDRAFSIIADASHFINCKGTITIVNCSHTGQGDDFINVHGINSKITKVVNNRTIEVNERGHLNEAGDEVWFINKETVQRGEVAVIESKEPVTENGKFSGFRYTFTKPVSAQIKENDFVENKTWNAELILRNCNILKKHRARGILVTTPKKVRIENNYFRTAGTAILIEGDLDYWFESGASAHMSICNNTFEDCLTSGNRDESRGQWGDAIITITPSHRPTDNKEEPYHKNICIKDNLFSVFDAPIVRARSVRGLVFTGNQIEKTTTYQPYTWQKSAFMLDGCRGVIVKDNKIDNRYTTREILIEHMKKNDVKTDVFNIDLLDNRKMNTHLEW